LQCADPCCGVLQGSRAGLRERVCTMRTASSMAAASADAVDVPKELPLRDVAQSGRVTTAQLDLDMQAESAEENNKASSVSGVQMHGAARKVLPEHCTVTSAPPWCAGVRISASNLCARVMQAIALLQHVARTMPDGPDRNFSE
jgi:hypothetical protein